MSDYTWPTEVIPSETVWRYEANTAAFPAPLTGAIRTLARGGDHWACTLMCRNLNGSRRAILQAFLARLRGQAHRVILPDHSYTRRGTLAANVLVKGAGQTGTSLLVDGAAGGATLLIGDQIAIGYALYMVCANATANASGEMTLTITPPLRSSPADNAVVTVTSPAARFVLASNTVEWSNAPGGRALGAISSVNIELVEDIAA